jgi:NAD(P)-dependent dehydrogenase (short-subunit alcohol dehydrogenase family)
MTRTYALTGSASGIGLATRTRLEARGDRVIGIDLHDAEVVADLSSPEGRAAMIDGVKQASDGPLDAVVAGAGIAAFDPATVRVNYFGAIATLEGLRPLLLQSAAPRAVVIASSSVVHPVDDEIVDACLAGDEDRAAAAPGASTPIVYASSKRALARWVRRNAPTEAWAGAGIPLNAIAPGTVVSPMTAPLLGDAGAAAYVDRTVPMPLAGHATPEEIAPLLDWLSSPENTQVTGQVVFIDGGADVVLGSDDHWRSVEIPEFDIELSGG